MEEGTMSHKKILFGMVTLALLAMTVNTANADIRPAQRYLAAQMTDTDVVLDAKIQATMQNEQFHQAVVEKDAATVENLVGTNQVEVFSGSQAPRAWVELQTQFLARKLKDHQITPSYGGGPRGGPSLGPY